MQVVVAIVILVVLHVWSQANHFTLRVIVSCGEFSDPVICTTYQISFTTTSSYELSKEYEGPLSFLITVPVLSNSGSEKPGNIVDLLLMHVADVGRNIAKVRASITC